MRTPICHRALGLLLLDWSSVVLNYSPGSIQAQWETLRVQQGSCLWWLVRVNETAPTAPNSKRGDRNVFDEMPGLGGVITQSSSINTASMGCESPDSGRLNKYCESIVGAH